LVSSRTDSLTYKLYTDGASRGNPGLAGAGAVLLDDQEEMVDHHYQYLGEMTNNMAEYQALIQGLEMVLGHPVKVLEIFLDSELIVKQIKGEYRVKDATLKGYFQEVQSLLQKLEGYTISHIPRGLNKEADRLANLAIDDYNDGL
jgi:ribonuclease HI